MTLTPDTRQALQNAVDIMRGNPSPDWTWIEATEQLLQPPPEPPTHHLYRWSSEFMRGYAPGDLIACARSVDEARQLLRAEFDNQARSRYRERSTFEADIAAEPEVCLTAWIDGSD